MAVSIALPTIGDELGIQQDQLQWVTNAYALSSGCLLLMFGRIADVYGRKKTFLAGALWLFAFTLGCAFVKGACCVVAVMSLSTMLTCGRCADAGDPARRSGCGWCGHHSCSGGPDGFNLYFRC